MSFDVNHENHEKIYIYIYMFHIYIYFFMCIYIYSSYGITCFVGFKFVGFWKKMPEIFTVLGVQGWKGRWKVTPQVFFPAKASKKSVIFRMLDVQDVGCWMFRMLDVGCSGC